MATKRKKPSVSQLAEKCAKDLQRLVRMKFADDNGYVQCVSCGVINHYKEMDGGHYIKRKFAATKLVEENIHPQCKSCNGFNDGNIDEYTLYMIDTYGLEKLRELNRLKRSNFKWNKFDIEDQHKEVKLRLKEQERRLGE